MIRRNFLRSGLALPFLRRVRAQNTPLVDAAFHLHPHHRGQDALDSTLLKTQSGLDDFITEKYHDQIATILAEWVADLVQSPKGLLAMGRVLVPDFLGASPLPADFDTMYDMVNLYLDVLDNLESGVAVAGFGFGGWIAAALAVADSLPETAPEPVTVDARDAPDIAWVAQIDAVVPDVQSPPKPQYLRAPDAQPQNAASLPRR